MRITKTKVASVVAATAVVALGGTAAMAFWTTGGTGGGSATTGNTLNLSVNQTNSVTGLYPGGPAQTLSGNFDNPNAFPVNINSVTAALGTLPAGCVAADFTIAGSTGVAQIVIPAGNGQGAWTGLTVQMNDTGVNQDGCKISSIPLVYTVH